MKNSITLLGFVALICCCCVAAHAGAVAGPISGGLPAMAARATDSISSLLLTSGRQTDAAAASSSSQQQPAVESQQQQQPMLQEQASLQAWAPANLQAHLSAVQSQAQRQISQLNGLVLSGANQLANSAAHAANLSVGANGGKYGNVLEVLSNVGKAIHQQIQAVASSSPNQIQIMTSLPNPGNSESANTKKNEYQSIVVNDSQPLTLASTTNQNTTTTNANGTTTAPPNYKEQGEQLRQEIVRRAGQLQQVVASSMDMLKSNGDLIVRRLLEQLNGRLDLAKSKADKIINEPAMNEVAVKALSAINQGLNNLNNIITNIVGRLDINNNNSNTNIGKDVLSAAQRTGGQSQAPSLLIDPTRFKVNFHQIGQQFSSALNAVQQQRQQQQQQRQQRNLVA